MHHVNTHFSFRENVRYSKLLINHISDIRTTPESSEVTDIDFSNEQKKWLIKGLNDYKDKKYLDELKEQVHLVFFLDRPVRLVLESYNLCGIMYSYMPITYMN